MPFVNPVNDQVTDSITQVNTEVLGVGPAIAMNNLYQMTSQALSNTAQNSTTIGQQTNIMALTATTVGVLTLYSIDIATIGVAIKKFLAK